MGTPPFIQILSSLDISRQQVKFERKSIVSSIRWNYVMVPSSVTTGGHELVVTRTGCVSLHEVSNLMLLEMSRVEICSLAYEGKFNELKEKIGLKQSLATKIDEVRF